MIPAETSALWCEVLDSLPEPTFIVDPDTNIRLKNRAAASHFGGQMPRRLIDIVDPPAATEFTVYLARCSGSRQPIPGATSLFGADGTLARFRCSGNLLRPADSTLTALMLLRLHPAEDAAFAAINRKNAQLNLEIRERRRTQVILEHTLHDRELLLSELHHRVRNSIQLLVGMFSAARRDAGSPEVHTALEQMSRRISAVAAVHQLLYRIDDLGNLPGDKLLSELSAIILRSLQAESRYSVTADPGIVVPNDAAVPLALIINELLANAVQHGPEDGRLHIALHGRAGTLELHVEDEGPLFQSKETGRRGSGLGLVFGLTRQIDGEFLLQDNKKGGKRCIVRFQAQKADMAARLKTLS